MEPLLVQSSDQIKKYINECTSQGTTPMEITNALLQLRREKKIFRIKTEGKVSFWMVRDYYNECKHFVYSQTSPRKEVKIQRLRLGRCPIFNLTLYGLNHCCKMHCDQFKKRRKSRHVKYESKEKGSFIGKAESGG